MAETSPEIPFVRCTKCGFLLPELSPHSAYHCDRCGAFLPAEKGSSVDDGLSDKSWEERSGEASQRKGNGETVGIDRGGRNERFAPMTSRYRDVTGKSPIRESNSGDLDVAWKSRANGSVLGDFDLQSKRSGRSMDQDGDVRKSPPRSVHGGFRKSSISESVLGHFDKQRSMKRDVVANSEEMEAREKVGAWFDQVKEEDKYANRLVTQKGSSSYWFHDESEFNRSQVSPRRRIWSLDEAPMGSGLSPREEQGGRRADQIVHENEFEYDDLYGRRRVEVPYDDWVRGGDHGLPRGQRDLRVQDGYVGEFWKGRNEFDHVHGNYRPARVGQGFPVYPNKGPSSYGSYYGYDQLRVPHESFSGSSSLQNTEMNRADLLLMYNELKEQLTRTGDLPENPTRRGHQHISSVGYYGGQDDYVHDELLRLRRAIASVDLEKHTRMRPHYMKDSGVPGPSVNDCNMDDINSYPPSRFGPKEFPFEDDPYWPQIQGRTSHHQSHYYPQRSAHGYIPRCSLDSAYYPSGLDPRRQDLHHPTLSVQIHLQAPPAGLGYKRYLNCETNPASDFPYPCGQCTSCSRFPYSTPRTPSSHSQNSVESKPDGSGSARVHGKKVVVVNQNQLLCHPIAGAAPFVICSICYELLRLPKKLMNKTQLRLQCGSCRTTLSFDFSKKSLSHASLQLQPKPTSTYVYDVPGKMSESKGETSQDGSLAGITNRESYDFDATGYAFPSIDSERGMKLEDRRLNSIEVEKKHSPCPSTSNVSKDGNDETDASCPSVNVMARSAPGSPLQKHSFDTFASKRSDEEETDFPSHDKGIIDRDVSSLNIVQNTDAHTKLERKSNDFRKVDASQSSTGVHSENDKGGSKKGESSFSSVIGNGFQDLSPPFYTSTANADVFVNGQPLAHRVVRRAEKLAGPISPGNYWYDSTAGFWGIMGNYCLGIIPPCIEEFRFPMPVDCAGGNTAIYVNGRELHETDLKLLASRGFPHIRNKSYVVDISGRVQDKETGGVVVNLGKLAPTVEKTKRGFGMQPQKP